MKAKLQHKTMFLLVCIFSRWNLSGGSLLELWIFLYQSLRQNWSVAWFQEQLLASGYKKVNVFYVWMVQYPAVVKDRV